MKFYIHMYNFDWSRHLNTPQRRRQEKLDRLTMNSVLTRRMHLFATLKTPTKIST